MEVREACRGDLISGGTMGFLLLDADEEVPSAFCSVDWRGRAQYTASNHSLRLLSADHLDICLVA